MNDDPLRTDLQLIRCRECRWPGECDDMHKCKIGLGEAKATDLVARLRAGTYVEGDECALNEEAADEIERLRHDLQIQAVNAATVLAAQAERDRLRDLLQALCDEQNGPPLERWREQWQRAYDQARAALRSGDVPEKHVCSFSYSGGAEQSNCVLCGAPRQGTRG